ncbi:hypothetical protein HaLaN_14291, partial [Haematococcus lacustris]
MTKKTGQAALQHAPAWHCALVAAVSLAHHPRKHDTPVTTDKHDLSTSKLGSLYTWTALELAPCIAPSLAYLAARRGNQISQRFSHSLAKSLGIHRHRCEVKP